MTASDLHAIIVAAMCDAQERAMADGEPGGAEAELAALRDLAGDPDALKELMSVNAAESIDAHLRESGFTGEITDSAGHHRKYVDGKQVAAAHDDASTNADTNSPHAEPARKLSTRIQGAVIDTLAKVMGATPDLHDAILDTVDDFNNFMYAKEYDALYQATGIPAKPLLVAIKHGIRLAHKAIMGGKAKVQESVGGAPPPDVESMADAVLAILQATAASVGSKAEMPSREDVIAALRKKLGTGDDTRGE